MSIANIYNGDINKSYAKGKFDDIQTKTLNVKEILDVEDKIITNEIKAGTNGNIKIDRPKALTYSNQFFSYTMDFIGVATSIERVASNWVGVTTDPLYLPSIVTNFIKTPEKALYVFNCFIKNTSVLGGSDTFRIQALNLSTNQRIGENSMIVGKHGAVGDYNISCCFLASLSANAEIQLSMTQTRVIGVGVTNFTGVIHGTRLL